MASTNGWQNYGLYMQYVDDNPNDLTPMEYRILALLVRTSFGYRKKTTSLSYQDMQDKSNSSKKTVSRTILSLVQKDWIKRITGQGYGPKTKYTYAVKYITGIHIQIDETPKTEPNKTTSKKGW